MTPDKRRIHSNYFTIILVLLIVIVTFGTIFFVSFETESAIKKSLQSKLISVANITSSQIDGDALEELNPKIGITPEYLAIRDFLYTIKMSDPDIAYIYTMRKNGTIIEFIVDGDDGITSDDYSLGDTYDEFEPYLLAGFDVPSVDEDFTTDEWGTFLSGFAPIRNKSGSVIGIIGVDINSTVVKEKMDFLNQTYYLLGFLVVFLLIIGIFINERRRFSDERRAKESEAKYRLFADNVQDIIWTADEKMQLTYISPSAFSMVGLTPQELIKTRVKDLMTGESYQKIADLKERINDIMLSSAPDNQIIREEIEMVSSSGKTIWTEIIITPIIERNQHLIGTVGVIRDINSRKKTEQEIYHQNEQLKIINQITLELAQLPKDIPISNLVVKKLTELTGAEFTIFSLYDVSDNSLHVKNIEVSTEISKDILNENGIITEKIVIPLNDAKYQEIINSTIYITDNPNVLEKDYFSSLLKIIQRENLIISNYIGIAYVLEDQLFGTSVLGMKQGNSLPSKDLLESFAHIIAVSLRRSRAETILLENEEKFRSFIEQTREGISIINEEGKIIEWNYAQEQITGISKDEAIGKYHWDLLAELIADTSNREITRKKIREDVLSAIKNGSQSRNIIKNYHISRSDGKTIIINHLFFAIQTAHGQMVGTLNLDVTEHRLSEESVNIVNKKLNLLNYVTFNDIQNAIFALRGFIALTKDFSHDNFVVNLIENEEKTVQKIVRSLDIARCYQDMGVHPPRWQNVKHVIILAISHLDLTSMKRDIDIEGIEIYADPLLEQVFFSIIENILLHAKNATCLKINNSKIQGDLHILIEDDGIGISDDNKEVIFSREYGSHQGMSLFLVREILGITGIKIQETGIFGRGARFEIIVPRVAYRFIQD
ncbi:MAG: PAS domain S-box protein [Methanomicrobiales archaeon]|nr:PAS domain S-box protein [Methanomicrobiales archaeon]